jgi:hypothetical protein
VSGEARSGHPSTWRIQDHIEGSNAVIQEERLIAVSEVAEIPYIRQTETCSSHCKNKPAVENRTLAPRQCSPPSVGHPVREVLVIVVRFSSDSQRTGMCLQILLQLSKHGMSF